MRRKRNTRLYTASTHRTFRTRKIHCTKMWNANEKLFKICGTGESCMIDDPLKDIYTYKSEPFRKSQVWIVGSKKSPINMKVRMLWQGKRNEKKGTAFFQIDWTRRLKSSFILNSREWFMNKFFWAENCFVFQSMCVCYIFGMGEAKSYRKCVFRIYEKLFRLSFPSDWYVNVFIWYDDTF